MKVVLFCGGLGTRLREHSDVVPKPLVNIGPRPIIWHIMRYYAHYGHKDFVICLGYQGDMIRDYFLQYDPYLGENFTIDGPAGTVYGENGSSIADWRITFVETGLHANIGQRLLQAKEYVIGEEKFLANYSDQLTDMPLDDYIGEFDKTGAIAGFLSVKPPYSYHDVIADENGYVDRVGAVSNSKQWVNGGYFVLKPEIFDYVREGEEFVEKPFERMAKEGKLWTKRHEGFWRPMDTFKDKITYDRMWGSDDKPWLVWK